VYRLRTTTETQPRPPQPAVSRLLLALSPQLSKTNGESAKDLAATIVELWTTGKEVAAYEAFYEAGYSNEMKLGIWECLQPNSKVRNGIKKIADENKQKAA
jgi:hypothetical protein